MLRARLPAVYPESARTCTSSEAHGRTLKRRVERIIFSIKNTSRCVCRDVLTFKRASFEVQGHFSFLCQVAKPLATLSIRKLQNKGGGGVVYNTPIYSWYPPNRWYVSFSRGSVASVWCDRLHGNTTPDNTDSIISHSHFSHVTYRTDSKISVGL